MMASFRFILFVAIASEFGSGINGAIVENDKIPDISQNLVKNLTGADFSFKGWSSDIDSWESPEIYKKELPQYLAGYDVEKRPVLVMEFGRWDTRKYVDKDPETRALYNKHVEKFWYSCQNSTSPDGDAAEGVVVIIDFQGLEARQLASLEAVKSQLYHARFAENIESRVFRLFFVNMSFIAETWTNLVRPIAGKFVGRAELMGQNKAKIAATLQEAIPKDQLPEWYGGTKDYKVVKVIG